MPGVSIHVVDVSRGVVASGMRVELYAVVGGPSLRLVAAGDISISVEPPAYRLVVRAATAPWVASFFEAQDVFTTQADQQLFPLVHERDQREGSRRVTRAFVFAEAARVVRTGRTVTEAQGEGAVALPLSSRARDAITSLFYIRTLPLSVGQHVRFPINEAGRNLLGELTVDGIERIRAGTQDIEAIRVTPLLQRRVQNGQQPTATIWLSHDERRLPVVIDLHAGFGHVRVELVSYQP